MATFLLELFSEEIPSRMQQNAAEQLQRLMLAGLEKNLLQPMGAKTFVSPRHLAIQITGLPTLQPDMKEERKGPKIGAPEQAMKGFLGATGLTVEQCEQRDGYYFATIERKGRPTAEVLKEISEATLAAFSWPKSMRWGNRPLTWVRPLHRITCLLDAEVIPVQFAHLTASNVTQGHRFLSPREITIPHAEQYEITLNNAHVMVDYAARRAKIAAGVATLAASHTLRVIEDEALLDEVTGLVEFPVPLLGTFEESFLQLPPEVLISEMKTHQRYFALTDAAGKLTNRFITVANMQNADGGKQVMDGNSRVVRARLSDGAFYWEQDQKVPLADWGKKLSDVVFHAKVGMMDAKVARIEELAWKIADDNGLAKSNVRFIAKLCKADLTTGMVGEFPELQGIMGRYYALAQGVHENSANGIRDHYKPLGASDSLPESKIAAIVSIADKLDSIKELFAVGEKPTGSKDPLALRRAAMGILRNVLHHNIRLDVKRLGISSDVQEFMSDRLKYVLRDEGVPSDIIDAAMAVKDYRFNPISIAKRARDLASWIRTPEGIDSLAAIKRCLNILAAEEKKEKRSFEPLIAPVFSHHAEKAVRDAVMISFGVPVTADKPQDLEPLTAPINQFFTDLLVTEEGHRDIRLGLLASVRQAALNIADFSKIEG